MELFVWLLHCLSLWQYLNLPVVGPLYRYLPSTTSPAVVNTHDQIAASLTSLYNLFIDLGYSEYTDFAWPPHSPAVLNRTKCGEVGLDSSAIGLLEKIPWPNGVQAWTILVGYSNALNFTDAEELEDNCDPTYYKIFQDPSYVCDREHAWLLPLTFYDGESDNCFLVDAQAGTIHKLRDGGYAEDNGGPSGGHYQNWTGKPTLELLESLYEEYYSLETIFIRGPERLSGVFGRNHPCYDLAKATMIDEYGWPDHFRRDNWVRDLEGLQLRWSDEDYARRVDGLTAKWMADREEPYFKNMVLDRYFAQVAHANEVMIQAE